MDERGVSTLIIVGAIIVALGIGLGAGYFLIMGGGGQGDNQAPGGEEGPPGGGEGEEHVIIPTPSENWQTIYRDASFDVQANKIVWQEFENVSEGDNVRGSFRVIDSGLQLDFFAVDEDGLNFLNTNETIPQDTIYAIENQGQHDYEFTVPATPTDKIGLVFRNENSQAITFEWTLQVSSE